MHQTLLNQAIFCFTFLYFEKIKKYIYVCISRRKTLSFPFAECIWNETFKEEATINYLFLFSFYVSEKYLPVSFFLFSFYICISLNMSYKLTEIEFKNCIFSLTMKNTTINICKYLLFLLYIIVFLVNFLYYK